MTKMHWEKLVDYLCEYYSFEFPDIPEEEKVKKINYVIQCNAQIFSKEYFDKFSCLKCGWCCLQMNDCPYFDPETKLCTTHDNLPYSVCDSYPWGAYDDLGIAFFSINCGKLMSGLHFYFDYVFEKMQKQYREEQEKTQ